MLTNFDAVEVNLVEDGDEDTYDNQLPEIFASELRLKGDHSQPQPHTGTNMQTIDIDVDQSQLSDNRHVIQAPLSDLGRLVTSLQVRVGERRVMKDPKG